MLVEPWGATDVASFLLVVEMAATDRRGTIELAGLALSNTQSQLHGGDDHLGGR
jgi:hypothetical protein